MNSRKRSHNKQNNELEASWEKEKGGLRSKWLQEETEDLIRAPNK